MFKELSLIRMASAMARHAGARHNVVAQNIANADTPGYRARDVKGFAEYVNEPFTARATRPGHAGTAPLARAAFRPDTFVDRGVDAGPNGNSVSLEHEMVKAVEAQGQHALATTIYRKVHDLMRLGLGRGR